MNEYPRDYRLFHYTREKQYLIEMLKYGIWPRFSEEEFSWLAGGVQYYIAFPIACFCDIPIAAAGHHRRKYGCYAVAIHKNNIEHLDLNPVWYIRDSGRYAEELRQRFQNGPRFTIERAKQCDLFQFLPLMKVAIGSQPSREPKIIDGDEAMDFTEELEWRLVAKTPSSDHWKESYERSFTNEGDHQKSLSSRIKLETEMIEEVFVKTTNDVEDLCKEFPKLRSKIKIWLEGE